MHNAHISSIWKVNVKLHQQKAKDIFSDSVCALNVEVNKWQKLHTHTHTPDVCKIFVRTQTNHIQNMANM